uniref:HMG box domain-containing protein n=1 Tax=Haemonchus contortus TaxID=6289 RepID=A0A7I4YGL7_HAECO
SGKMSAFRHPQSTPLRSQPDFAMKAPKPPDRPLVPYMRYSGKCGPKVRAENPDAQLWDIGKIIGQMWRDISDADKAVYQHEYEIEKVEYEKAFKAYQNSHAYQQYVKREQKANEKSSRSRMEVGGVVIQPVDEEDAGNELSCRTSKLPVRPLLTSCCDGHSNGCGSKTVWICCENKLNHLSAHQSKLEEELVKLEEIHREKKRQIEKGSEEFAENLKRVCEEKPQLDEAKYAELLEEMKGKLLEAYKSIKRSKMRSMQDSPLNAKRSLKKLLCWQNW